MTSESGLTQRRPTIRLNGHKGTSQGGVLQTAQPMDNPLAEQPHQDGLQPHDPATRNRSMMTALGVNAAIITEARTIGRQGRRGTQDPQVPPISMRFSQRPTEIAIVGLRSQGRAVGTASRPLSDRTCSLRRVILKLFLTTRDRTRPQRVTLSR